MDTEKGSDRMYSYYKKKQRTYRIIRVDPQTWEWLNKHPHTESTIKLCQRCGSHYMPSLGHTCKGV